MRTRIPRRTFLRGAGVAIALPMLDAMIPLSRAASSAPQAIKRFVCLSNNYGVYPEAFFPSQDQPGPDYRMPETLQPLEKHRRDFTVFSNLDHGNTGGHQGVPVLLSGVKPTHAAYYPEGNLSIDQKIAEHVGAKTRFSSLTLQVNDANLISFTRTGVQVPALDLQRTFRALFIEEDQAVKATAADKLKRQTSILDVVREEARVIERGLGKQDQQKFAEYLSAVRSLELKIKQQQPWIDKSKPNPGIKPPPQTGKTTTDLAVMMELIALAIQTDSSRAFTLTSGFANGDLGLSGGYHGFTPHGQREKEVQALKLIERHQIAQMAHLIDLLKAQVDPVNGGTLFDHTAILFGCGMATGEHSNRNLPLVLAGGGFQHGEHKVYPDAKGQRVPAANLLLSILQNHGLEVDRFGTSTSTLTGLKWS
ncbi:MAG: DUF1552 domain-containing protein [Planctomycetota bacterium]